MFPIPQTEIQLLTDPFLEPYGINLSIHRLDRIHTALSGNKWYKLTHNLAEAKRQNQNKLLTFGGAYSNHIYAVAAAGKEWGFETIGVIRGEKMMPLNPTLSFAENAGMTLHFISRQLYKEKNNEALLIELKKHFGDFYLLPEGGTNELAVRGCEEIITAQYNDFDYIVCPVGTGGTLAGIASGLNGQKKIIGIPVLNTNGFLEKTIAELLLRVKQEIPHNWNLINDYTFGGYAKFTTDLITFINTFYERTRIPLDPIYTGKMVYGVYDLIQKTYFKKGEKILVIHTGGLQGIAGFNERFGNQILF